ncbi:hypothetical protein Y032_0155g3033 [Ancylostoma ceylanicum]|uniref:Uncharacterized protein n=1 Tax=Ancylostoma ceylanicum TaxID=53326 RepID=A0A016SZD5_9BILA|nr:hypothetical protein Y032_0155g3033 [Ancylostoma ceylanicum]
MKADSTIAFVLSFRTLVLADRTGPSAIFRFTSDRPYKAAKLALRSPLLPRNMLPMIALLLLQLSAPSLACIGGFGGGGACCAPSAPACTNPCPA